MSWIVDSSIAIAWVFEDESNARTEALLDRTASEPFMVPTHWPLEVTNVLRSAVKRRRVTEPQAANKAAALMSLPVRYDALTHQVAFTTTFDLARKHALTSYESHEAFDHTCFAASSLRLGVSA